MINTLRHSEIYDPTQWKDKRVAIIGVGTIGSHLALTLARMQVSMTMYDPDTIEEHNLATQSYTAHDVGKYKVNAVREQCEAINGDPASVEAFNVEFNDYQQAEGINVIVSCVDSIEVRRNIARVLSEMGITLPIHDGRIGGEQVEVYRYPNAKEWLAGLPEQAHTDPCGARFTAYTANVCAGLLANNIKRELLGQTVTPRILYDARSSSFLTPKV